VKPEVRGAHAPVPLVFYFTMPGGRSMNPLKALPLALLLIGPAQAQSGGPVGKPCTINENMKGTCFYNADGQISYWIVRWWRDSRVGGGPEGALNEIVGYPAFLKAQQEYNSWVSSSPDPKPEQHCWTSEHGWGKEDRGLNSICMPNHISETGELTLDTLRIPVFMTGAQILSALDRLKNDCSAASETASTWNGYAHQLDVAFTAADDRKGWMCWTKWPQAQIPKGKEFADWQALLEARSAALDEAEKASRRYDELITSVPFEYHNFEPHIAADKLPASLIDQLSALQATSVAALRTDTADKNESAGLEEKYRMGLAEAARLHKEEQEQEWAKERNTKEYRDKLDGVIRSREVWQFMSAHPDACTAHAAEIEKIDPGNYSFYCPQPAGVK
jgi:hypothetical protein